MKRKIWIPILVAVIALCVAGAIILMRLMTDSTSAQESSLPEVTEPEVTDPKDAMLAAFKQMLNDADRMLTSGEIITMHNHEYLQFFVNFCAKTYPESFSYTEKDFRIDTAKLAIDLTPIDDPENNQPLFYEQNNVRYLLLLAQILEQYPENIKLVDDLDYLNKSGPPPKLYLLVERKVTDFEDPEALWTYLHESDYNVFTVHLTTLIITHPAFKTNHAYQNLYLRMVS